MLTLDVIEGVGPVYGPSAAARAVPGVVILHGAEGAGAGWSHRFAVILAAHGMMALPLAYGGGDIFGAGDIHEVDLAVVPAAGRALLAQERCAHVGLMGWSKGGEAALLVASQSQVGSPFDAVAAHAAPDRVGNAFDVAAFRAGGRPFGTDPFGPCAWVWDDAPDAALVPGAAIEAEKWDGPLFLSVGEDDDVLDPAMTHALAQRRRAAGQQIDVLSMPGQGHGLDFDREPELWVRLLAFFDQFLGPRTAGASGV